MTMRQVNFCWAYLSRAVCVGAVAARMAGYKPRWARCQASRLLRRRDVQDFLRYIREETSHPSCLACGQPLRDSGYGLRVSGEFWHLERVLDSWNLARWRMEANGEWSRTNVNNEC